jgi:hypothetical protein
MQSEKLCTQGPKHKMRRKTLETRVPWPASAPTHPDPSLGIFFDRRMDGLFLLAKVDAERGRSACSTHVQGTHACGHAISWMTGECLRRFELPVCLHFACLVTFSWMRRQQAIQRLRSGFHEPETSYAHAEMLRHG